MALCATLDSVLPLQDLSTYQEDGNELVTLSLRSPCGLYSSTKRIPKERFVMTAIPDRTEQNGQKDYISQASPAPQVPTITLSTDSKNDSKEQPPGNVTRIAAVGIGVSLFWAVGIFSTLGFLHKLGMDATVLGGCIAMSALWTFLLFYRGADIRTTVTAAFVVLYLGFFVASMVPGAASTLQAPGSFAHSIWDSLSAIMIAIIAFYFGGKAYEKASANKSKRDGGSA